MFEIFKFKSKTTEEIPKEIPTNTTDQLEVVVDDSDLDLGDLESGPSGPKIGLPDSKNGKQSKLDAHASTKTHLTCIAKWSGHNNIIVKQTGTVHTQLTTQHQLEIAANREYMNCLIDITLYLAAQGLAFRGHDENKTSLNQGNFKEACVLFSKHIPKFSEIFNKDTNYTNHHIQDEIIDICANSVRDLIIEEVGTGTFSIMCDEALCYKDEQMSLCIRYVKDLDIQERFLGFIDCSEKQDAQALSDPHFILPADMKLQAFSILLSVYMYIFLTLQKNHQLTDLQKSLGLKIKTIGRISNTRWNCGYKNFQALKQCFKSILSVLNNEIENKADRDVNEAIGILATITKGKFVVVLLIMTHVLSCINVLSNMLQDKNATLGKSAKLINSVIKSFEDSRTSESFSSMWTSIQIFAKVHGISIDVPSQAKEPKRKKQQPSHLVQFLVSTTTGATSEAMDVETTVAEDYFRINIYFKDLSGLNICQQSLRSEMMVAKNYLVEPERGDIEDIKKNISPQVFPNLYKMIQIALTLPISSATCERSFSAMRKIKTWLRTSIHQKKFNEHSILYIEKDKTKALSNEAILNTFNKQCNRIIKLS
ncbi:hypothetical protein QTP88_026579 [Uroleucon formosanum]